MKRQNTSWLRTTNILFGAFILFLIIILVLTVLFGNPHPRYVLLSFDVEPVDDAQDVLDVLEVIYRNNISATFFVTGEYAEKNPQLTGFMTGGELACHGYSHKPFTRMNQSEKQDELRRCKDALRSINGKDPVGFRAPYNKVDGATLEMVETEGFLYDASMIRGWGMLYPRVDGFSFGEIPVSSVLGLPMEDVFWLHYLEMPDTYFYIMKNKKSGLESYLFHPHHISKYKNEFEEFIKHLKKANAIFISHRELIEMHEGV
jgi:peptidoglycan/xylan/chitin deacetylase (PgdA/CDA1 family)